MITLEKLANFRNEVYQEPVIKEVCDYADAALVGLGMLVSQNYFAEGVAFSATAGIGGTALENGEIDAPANRLSRNFFLGMSIHAFNHMPYVQGPLEATYVGLGSLFLGIAGVADYIRRVDSQ